MLAGSKLYGRYLGREEIVPDAFDAAEDARRSGTKRPGHLTQSRNAFPVTNALSVEARAITALFQCEVQ